MTRIAFYTFGCKLNQCETAGIRAQFSGPDYAVVPFEEPAEIYVINTCSVTGRADAQARQLVRRTIRDRAGSRVVVAGCYAQRAPRELAAIPGVALVAGNAEKDRLREIVESLAPAGETPPAGATATIAVSDLRKTRRSFELAPVEFGERTRAFLRVQDGCDAACSFCIIPHLRGRSTSLPPEPAVARVAGLVERGYREIVLTGIHLGMFGRDRDGGLTLADLVGMIDAIPGDFRIRLSSIEPQEIDAALIGRLASGGRLVPHLHVPLQSGCDRVLHRMNRTYTSGEYRAVVERIERRVPAIGLGADVIVGFPGETDADFAETVTFIEELPFTYLHVFPWSPRAGTRAASLPGRVSGPVMDERSRVLRDLSDRKRREFMAAMIGRPMTILVEEPSGDLAWEGWSERYVRVAFPYEGGEDLTNRFVRLQGTAVSGDMVMGRAVEPAFVG